MKFKPSIAFDEFSGSAGNVTAAKINGRSYIKRKPIPTNPNTEKQQEVRNRFKEIAKAYKALTQEKKECLGTALEKIILTCNLRGEGHAERYQLIPAG